MPVPRTVVSSISDNSAGVASPGYTSKVVITPPRAITQESSMGDPHQIQRLIEALRKEVQILASITNSNPLGSCRLIRNVTIITVGWTYVAHGLGRPWLGFIITNSNLPTSVLSGPAIAGYPNDKFIRLSANTQPTLCDVLVF